MRNKGMLWKTPWKRRKPVVPPKTYPMWFFGRFGPSGSGTDPNSVYRFANLAPATGDVGPPFWVGLVTAFPSSKFPSPPLGPAFAGQGYGNFGWDIESEASLYSSTISCRAEGAGAQASSGVDFLGSTIRAVVSLATFTSDGVTTTCRLWADGNLVAQTTGPTIPPLAGLISMGARYASGVHGWAGGNALPTNDEIIAWFKETKNNLEIAEIPGKTFDRFSATSVQPNVPNPLPTLGSGQNMDYVVPVAPDPGALNFLIPVSFGY